MSKLYIICIDDQPEVLNALEQDLSSFEEYVSLEVCDSGDEALELIEEVDSRGNHVALIISDQVMPGKSGVDTLSVIHKDPRFTNTQKILLTGLATHQDTIDAINSGGIDFYVQKPWSKEKITDTVKKGLTEFIVAQGVEYEDYMPILDQEILYRALRNRS
jgi:two-component system chemotaxis response regulator CheY